MKFHCEHSVIVLYFCVSPRKGKCKQIEEGQECFLGMRLRQYHMLCGALLRVWKRVSDIVSDITNSSILQIVRLKTKQNSKQVGELTFLLSDKLTKQIIAMNISDSS